MLVVVVWELPNDAMSERDSCDKCIRLKRIKIAIVRFIFTPGLRVVSLLFAA